MQLAVKALRALSFSGSFLLTPKPTRTVREKMAVVLGFSRHAERPK
jgi:hypothetical protein